MRIQVEGSRPAAEAWALYTRPSRWSEWAPQIRGVRGHDGPVIAGARGVVLGPLLVRVPFVIEAVDPTALRWTWRVGVGPVGVRMDHGVDAEGSGCRVWADIHAPAPLVLPYLPVARLALRRLALA
jgi:hypothetical protein